MSKFVSLGEIMLRLKTPNHERFFQSGTMEATFGGGEANVAVALANYGLDASFVTALPDNAIGDAAIRELRGFGVDTSNIRRSGDRVGIYFLEAGANQRPSKVVYDRAASSIAQCGPDDFDWDAVFADFDLDGDRPLDLLSSLFLADFLSFLPAGDLDFETFDFLSFLAAPPFLFGVFDFDLFFDADLSLDCDLYFAGDCDFGIFENL